MIELKRATLSDAELIWKMQKQAFRDLADRYQDYNTNPGCEPFEKVIARLEQPVTYFYFILFNNTTAGAIRIVDTGLIDARKRISPLFVLPEFRNMGIAQEAIRLAEELHGHFFWALDTILQEKGNCYLYEKMGYRQTGEYREISDIMTLVHYQKD